MRVLVVTPWFPSEPGDHFGSFVLDSVVSLLELGHPVFVLVTRPWMARRKVRPEKFQNLPGLEVAGFPSLPRYLLRDLSGPLFRLATDARIRDFARSCGASLIHAHTEDVAYGCVRLARQQGLPTVVTLHGVNTARAPVATRGRRAALRQTLEWATRVVLVGEPIRNHFASFVEDASHFRIVPNGFNLEGRDAPRPRGVRAHALRIVSVSNLAEGKGIELNLQALARFDAAGFRQWRYEIVGDGPERRSLERLTSALGLEGRTRFLGTLRHPDVIARLSDADVFLLPSYREAFGVAYLEAMAMGLLTVGVEGQGAAEVITHGETGWLVRPRDVDSVLDALIFCEQERDKAARIAVAAQQHVRGNYTWRHHAERLSAVFEEAAGDGRPGG
jgi:glycosyltransferase involved in cell wall biosynthesis